MTNSRLQDRLLDPGDSYMLLVVGDAHRLFGSPAAPPRVRLYESPQPKGVCVEGMLGATEYNGVYAAAGETEGRPRYQNGEGKHLYRSIDSRWCMGSAFDPAVKDPKCRAHTAAASGPLPVGRHAWRVLHNKHWKNMPLKVTLLATDDDVHERREHPKVAAQQQLADAKAVCVEGMPWPGWSGVYVAAGENDGWPRFESDEGKHLGYSKHWGKWVLARAFDPAGRSRQAYAASPAESEDGELLLGTNDWMVYERRWNTTTLALVKLCDEAEVTTETDRLAAEATAKRAAAKAAAQQQLKGKAVGVEGVPPERSQELNGVYIAAEGNDGWPQFKNAEGHHLCYSSEYFSWLLTDTVGSTAGDACFVGAPFSSIDGLLPIGDRKLLTWTLTVSLLTAEEALQRQTRRLQGLLEQIAAVGDRDAVLQVLRHRLPRG